MADPFTSAVQSFAQFGRQGLLNQQTRQGMEMNQLALDSENANRALNEFEGAGIVQFNPDNNTYMVAPDWYQKLQQVPETERQSLLAGVQSYLGAYEDKGKVEVGQISGLVPVKGKLPTSLQDSSEEEKQAWLSDPNNVAFAVPIKRKDGILSFITRNRSSSPDDDEAVILSGSQVASWIGARANKLNRLRNPEAYRAGAILNQQRGTLAPTGTGQAGVTFDTLMDELTNELDRVETNPELAGTGAQTDSLGQVLSLWETSYDENLKKQYNQQNVGGTSDASDPRVGQRGIEFKEAKNQAFKDMDKEAGKTKSKVPLLKGGGGLANISTQIPGIIDGSVSGKDIKYSTNTVLYNFWKTKEGNEGLTRNSDEWKAVTSDAEAMKQLAGEYFPAAKQQMSDAGFDLRYLEDYTDVGDVKEITAPMVQSDFPDMPDLTGITTKEQALELLDSGKLSQILSQEVIDRSRTLLQEQGITDSTSFNKAVQEGKIKDPYIHSLIIANAIAGPGATQTNIRAQALELFNNIKTGDPQAGPRQLVADQINLMNTKADYLKWLATQSSTYRDAIKEQMSKLDDAWDETSLAYFSKEDDANYEGNYVNALTSTEGFLNELKLAGVNDPLGYIKKVLSPTTYEKISNGLSRNIYDSLGSNWNIFTADFWSDIPRENNPNALSNAIDTMGTLVDSQGRVTKFVRIKRVGGRIIEVEGSDTPANILNQTDPRTYNILIRMLPVVNRQDNGQQ
jgi:hypothetical protein